MIGCRACNGTGLIERRIVESKTQQPLPCLRCDGTGMLPYHRAPRADCQSELSVELIPDEKSGEGTL